MDSVPPTGSNDGSVVAHKDIEAYALAVDPFLVEALQNPRHRLTILWMELDIQKFLQNSEQQFEFQHFPTSYLRLAAHRVAQHYGLQTLVQDNIFDGVGTKIMVKKLPESRYPAVRLSEVPAKQLDDGKHEQIKIVMRPRLNKASLNGESETGVKRSSLRTMEERKEEYDRARARIFSSPSSPELEESMYQAPLDGKNICIIGEENEASKNYMLDLDKSLSVGDGCTSSRVAILRDREKDRIDPDYDRSYRRYVKNVPANQSFSLAPFDLQKFQPPLVQYDAGFPHLGQMPRTQASLSYRTPIMAPLCSTGFNRTSRDAVYMQWPTSAMMYAQSYEQFRHAVFQAPYVQNQQPLSFDYSQNH